MGLCLEGLRHTPICLGDPFTQITGSEPGLNEASLLMLGAVVLAALFLMFRAA